MLQRLLTSGHRAEVMAMSWLLILYQILDPSLDRDVVSILVSLLL